MKYLSVIFFSMAAMLLTSCNGTSVDKDGNLKIQNSKTELRPDDSKIKILKSTDKGDALGNIHVYVTVENTSNRLCKICQLKVLFADTKDNVVGSGIGTGMNIPAGKTKIIECLAIDIGEEAERYGTQVELATFE